MEEPPRREIQPVLREVSHLACPSDSPVGCLVLKSLFPGRLIFWASLGGKKNRFGADSFSAAWAVEVLEEEHDCWSDTPQYETLFWDSDEKERPIFAGGTIK